MRRVRQIDGTINTATWNYQGGGYEEGTQQHDNQIDRTTKTATWNCGGGRYKEGTHHTSLGRAVQHDNLYNTTIRWTSRTTRQSDGMRRGRARDEGGYETRTRRHRGHRQDTEYEGAHGDGKCNNQLMFGTGHAVYNIIQLI